MNEFDTAVKAYASQTGGRTQLDEMLDDWRDGIMDFGYDADDIDDGMKTSAIIALMRIIYGKDDDPREPASVLMMSLIEIEIQTSSIGKTHAGEPGWHRTHRRIIIMRTMRTHDDMFA